jgi:hypothetical protein
MTVDATDEGTLVAALPDLTDPVRRPHVEVRAVETKLDLPPTFLAEAAIFGTIANKGTPALAGLASSEREALLGSLVNTLWRATYHKGRFEQYVMAAYARFEQFEGRVVGDSVAQCILFETQALLAAMRAFVEEVLYVGARRAGDGPATADRRSERELRDGGTLPETLVLDQRRAWFDELTDYRNALVHRGTLGQFGYVPPAVDVPHADDPTFNVMLVPDRASLRRPNRPDAWTFTAGGRLEVLVRGSWSELLAFAREVGACWGCAMPEGLKVPPAALFASTVLVLPRGTTATRK